MTPNILESVKEPGISCAPCSVSAWVRRHQDGLWRYLRFLGCPAADAPDIMQEALIAAVDAQVHEVMPDAIARAWLRTTAANRYRSHLRRRDRRPECCLLPEDAAEAAWREFAGAEGEGDAGGYVAALRECLAKLPARARRAIELRYGEGVSRETMAGRLSIAPQGVKTLLRRIRDSLRSCIEANQKDRRRSGSET